MSWKKCWRPSYFSQKKSLPLPQDPAPVPRKFCNLIIFRNLLMLFLPKFWAKEYLIFTSRITVFEVFNFSTYWPSTKYVRNVPQCIDRIAQQLSCIRWAKGVVEIFNLLPLRPCKIDYVFSVTRALDKFYIALLNFISENARCYFFPSQWEKMYFLYVFHSFHNGKVLLFDKSKSNHFKIQLKTTNDKGLQMYLLLTKTRNRVHISSDESILRLKP